MGQSMYTSDEQAEVALLVGLQMKDRTTNDVEDTLDELEQLSKTAGAQVAGRVVCRQGTIHPATFVGKGKAAEIGERVRAEGITTVVFDDELSPAQGRNLGKIIEAKIVDRTQVILDIFAQHAQTKEGRLQIELAQLQYLLPRLRRMWTHLERQKGGIGLRGPGEKQLELDRRRIQDRITRIREALDVVRSRRAEQRRGRRRHGWALLTLVGYTNAGKSTLLNSLTGAAVASYDQLFATLDPTTRQLRLPNHQSALLTDTVGFIRKLPHHLVESFKATLEEVNEADLLLHVIDASHPQVDQQIAAVERVLEELGAGRKPLLPLLNKTDKPEGKAGAARLMSLMRNAVPISALTGEGMDQMRESVSDYLRSRHVRMRLRLPPYEGKVLAAIHNSGRVFHQSYEEDGTIVIEASVPGKLYSRCAKYGDGQVKDESSEGAGEG